jgi:hypothetical protein
VDKIRFIPNRKEAVVVAHCSNVNLCHCQFNCLVKVFGVPIALSFSMAVLSASTMLSIVLTNRIKQIRKVTHLISIASHTGFVVHAICNHSGLFPLQYRRSPMKYFCSELSGLCDKVWLLLRCCTKCLRLRAASFLDSQVPRRKN